MDLRHVTLLLVLFTSATAADGVDRILAEWDQDAMRAKQAYDGSLTRANDKAVKAYQAAAKAAARRGDNATAMAAWRAVLEINRAEPSAREYFTATGGLDQVLTQLDQPTDLLGNPVAKPALTMPAHATAITIGALPGQEHVLGSLRAGQQVLFQYVSGTWNPRAGGVARSPDSPAAADTYRLVVVDSASAEPVVVGTVAPGSAATPSTFTAPRTISRAVLRIQPTANPAASTGSVTYRIAVQP